MSHKVPGDGKALSGIRSDYVFSSAGSFSVVMVTVVLFGWIGRTLGPEELGLFSQIRRVSAMWVPIGCLGLQMSLGRFIPRLDDVRLIRRRLLQAMGLVLAILGLHCVVAALPYGSRVFVPVLGEYLELVWPLVFQLSGLCVLVLPYAALRGLHRIRLAAFVQVVGYAIWPLLATALCAGDGLAILVSTIGLGQLAIGFVTAFCVLLYVQPLAIPTSAELDSGLGTWIVYGVARLPGGLTQFILWAAIPIILLQWERSTEVALANAVTSLVNLPVMVLGPLAFVLLPRLSLAQVQGEDEEVKEFIRKGMRVAWELQLPATFTLLLFLDFILEAWLGFSGALFLETGRWMIMSIPALSIYTFLRPAIDARSVVPYGVFAQALGIFVGGLWCLLHLESQITVELGRAFFIAQSIAGIAAAAWCLRLHTMRASVPLVRLVLQFLPLAVGMGLVFELGLSFEGLGVWVLAMALYWVALKKTNSPVVDAALRFLERLRR